MDCLPASIINYAIGLLAGWWMWGRRERALRAAVERYTKEANAVLKGVCNDGSGGSGR